MPLVNQILTSLIQKNVCNEATSRCSSAFLLHSPTPAPAACLIEERGSGGVVVVELKLGGRHRVLSKLTVREENP